MNDPYFAAEDRLMGVGSEYGGRWNAQLGFEYKTLCHRSSAQSLLAIDAASPFDTFYRNEVIPQVHREHPRVIGLCLASVYQIIPTLQLCKTLRQEGYRGFIVLGGNTVSRLVREMAIRPMFDLIDGLIPFQGEEPLLQLSRALEHGRPLECVPRLVWRDEGCIRENPGTGDLDPDTLPTPDYTSLPVGRYWGENYLNLVAARGCYYGKCNFCAIPYGWGGTGFAGARSVDSVFRDMQTLSVRHGINRFKFVDEAFPPPLMRALAERIVAEGLSVEWEAYVRFESAWYDEGFVRLVARAGFRKGYFGLEMLPSETRTLLNKNDRARPELLLRLCGDYGVKVHFFCMVGFPGTGAAEARALVDFLLGHQDEIDTADLFPWTYAKHTRVAGVEPLAGSEDDWALEFAHRPRVNGGLSSDEVADLAARHEDELWRAAPRLLHPTYRLVSPWAECGRPGVTSGSDGRLGVVLP